VSFCKKKTKIETKQFRGTKNQRIFLKELKLKVNMFKRIKNIFNSQRLNIWKITLARNICIST